MHTTVYVIRSASGMPQTTKDGGCEEAHRDALCLAGQLDELVKVQIYAGDVQHIGRHLIAYEVEPGAADLPEWEVEVARTISTSVRLKAPSAEAAAELVGMSNYPLPPRDEWTGQKDWSYVVTDEAGREVLEQS